MHTGIVGSKAPECAGYMDPDGATDHVIMLLDEDAHQVELDAKEPLSQGNKWLTSVCSK